MTTTGCASEGAGAPRDVGADSDTPVADASAAVAPMIVRDYGVFLEVSFGGSDPVLMRYDTGSPTTALDATHASKLGLAGGVHEAHIGKVRIGPRSVTLVDWIEAGVTYPGMPGPVGGVVGNDFFTGYSVGLHVRASELWLWLAGGRVSLPADAASRGASERFDDTSGYLVMPRGRSDGGAEGVWLFDTGAVNSLIYADALAAPDDVGGRSVPMVTFDNRGSTVVGNFRRARSLQAGGIVLEDTVVVVVDTFELLTSVAESIGEPVVGLIGMSGLFDSYTVIDYPGRAVTVYPYADSGPLFRSPFVGYGFVVAGDGRGGLIVQGVAPGSFAASAGVLPGDRVVAVDGRPLVDAKLRFTSAALIAGDPGEVRTFELQRGDRSVRVRITAEDLLPEERPR